MFVGNAICYELFVYEFFVGRIGSEISRKRRKRCLHSFFQYGGRGTRAAAPQIGVKLLLTPLLEPKLKLRSLKNTIILGSTIVTFQWNTSSPLIDQNFYFCRVY